MHKSFARERGCRRARLAMGSWQKQALPARKTHVIYPVHFKLPVNAEEREAPLARAWISGKKTESGWYS